ncbi:alpha-1,2-fucosyltransferase [Parvibium lacunae]|uniref:Alpha-1,2-fucosyltransferase n=1 Tax=Parvibium lacunae TaxID=1888893 RepID=A0A368L1Q5_9BURK|nr:alpha-1,2-fucosyltransferase [Parvibium lacunae]RCS57403.1 alpha-1,2-fucosyltransferase [Parvibium lacunae]
MIISKVLGGLGNQMFQYACGLAVAQRNNLTLGIDATSFSDYSLHQGYELTRIFELPEQCLSAKEIQREYGWKTAPLARRFFGNQRIRAVSHTLPMRVVLDPYYYEPHLHYWPGIEAVTTSAYLDGHWQSERYFQHCEKRVRERFIFKPPLEGRNRELLAMIEEHKANHDCEGVIVSLHVRRGDYVNNPSAVKIYHQLDAKYYDQAITYMRDKFRKIKLLIFSDDIKWVKSTIKLVDEAVFIDHNRAQDSYIDMQLMSLCQHHIIANSTFSWWGAWLNPSPEKVVIAPKRWFANQFIDKDIIPAPWIKI